MGDRGNIVIRYENNPAKQICFYTHSYGSYLGSVVRRALSRRQRWDDWAYLARIIFCEMVKGREGEEIGFGISLDVCDNEHDLLIVDVDAKKIIRESEDGGVKESWTFEQFVSAKPIDPW